MKPEKHPEEDNRLAALRAYNILDSLPEADYDDLVRIAASVCGSEIAAITLIDETRQWFKSAIGLDGISHTSRDASVCAHAILNPRNATIVLDLQADERFSDSPLVNGEEHQLRFYAGVPILAPDEDLPLGAICVADTHARLDFTPEQQNTLAALSRQVANLLALRRRKVELLQANENLATLSETDALTGLPNRRCFEKHLAEVVALQTTARRTAKETFSLCALDVDHFKQFNDTHGHAAGDEVLQIIAEALRASTRSGGDKGDFAARIGGEEFVLLLPQASLAGAVLASERLREAVAALWTPYGPVTISVGVATFDSREAGTPSAGARLLAAADRALYQAKATGRNRVATESTLTATMRSIKG